MNFDLFLGDELRQEIENIRSPKQRAFFKSRYEQYLKYLKDHDEFITFNEFLKMYP